MAKFFTLVSFILLLTFNSYSASNIIVQNGSQTQAFESMKDAVDNATAGSTIYVPGGTFDANELLLNKELHFIGAGYHPNTAVGASIFTGTFRLLSGADGTTLTGLRLYLVIGEKSENSTINNITITRCFLTYPHLSYGWDKVQSGSNFIINECIIEGAIHCGNAGNLVISNNIIYQVALTSRPLTLLKNAIVANNIIFTVDNIMGNMITGTIFRNNIIPNGRFEVTNARSENIMHNNLLCNEEGIQMYGVSESSGNEIISRDKLFVNQTGGTFNYDHDYHLTQDALNAITGTDDTQVGIYGGDYPFKDGGAPINPQITEKNVSISTNPKGHLKVEIKVNAQNK